jgi:AraC family transcriptional regulator
MASLCPEPRLNVDSLKLTIERQVEISGMIAEIRNYDWSNQHALVATSEHICFTRTLATQRQPQLIKWKVPGSRRFITVGSAGVAPAMTQIEVRREPDHIRAFILHVEPATFHRITGLPADWYGERLMLRLNNEGFAAVRLLDEMAEELLSRETPSQPLIGALATTFLIRFGRIVRSEWERTGSGLSDWQMKRVRELIDTRPANQLGIGMLAEACGISGRHLMRGFKAATGMTVHRYIEQVRMDRAKRLLSTTHLPLEVIAGEVGFASGSHMSSAFVRAQGMPPSVFRQQFHRQRVNRTGTPALAP